MALNAQLDDLPNRQKFMGSKMMLFAVDSDSVAACFGVPGISFSISSTSSPIALASLALIKSFPDSSSFRRASSFDPAMIAFICKLIYKKEQSR